MKIDEELVLLKNGEKIRLCSPEESDAQALADHYNLMLTETKFLVGDVLDGLASAQDEIEWIKANLQSKRDLIAVARLNGKIVGLGILTGHSKTRTKHRGHLSVSVQKAHQRKGIASAIMNIIIKYAQKLGFEQLELEVVEENIPARKLYEKFGFVENGKILNCLKYSDNSYADCVCMTKFLKN